MKKPFSSHFQRSLTGFLLSSLLLQGSNCGRPEGTFTEEGRTGVTSVEIQQRILLGEDVEFGKVGAYETLVGKVHYTLDPFARINSAVADAHYATGEDGLVRYSADLVIVKPVEMERGNGALLYHVVNRGNFDSRVLAPACWEEIASATCGSRERTGRLLQQGFTLVFSGWQADVIQQDHRLRLFVPEAGGEVTGEVLGEIQVDARQTVAYLGAPGHLAYPVDPQHASSGEMRVHRNYADPGELIARGRWRFETLDENGEARPDSEHIYYPEGFEPQKIYTVCYRTNRSPVMGLCFPAVRDLVSFLGSTAASNPLCDVPGECPIRYRLAYGSSQSGRFLRNFLYQGFNQTTEGERVFDGILANVPGCRMGFFNYRHAQPSRAWGFYPNFDFPFTDLVASDPVTGQSGGILENVPEALRPKLFYIHHSGEYWSNGAALSHVALENMQDMVLPENVRMYTFSGTAHGFAELEEGHPEPRNDYLLPFNPNPTYLLETPLFEALARWVMRDVAPPPSSYPRTDRGELVEFSQFRFPKVPGVESPAVIELHPRFDWGPRFRNGILDNPLPRTGALFPVMVPVVSPDGNELGGIKTPHVAVPVASYTGWNYPASSYRGASRTCVARLSGAWIPFSTTESERQANGDERKSLAELYDHRDDYLARLSRAARELVERGLLFREDIDLVLDQGAAMYDYVAGTR